MNKVSKVLMTAVLVMGLMGCGDEDPAGNGSTNSSSPNNNSTSNNTTPNNTTSNNTTSNNTTSNNTTTCEPITECPADQCGTVDDGCGGTVTCATDCPCEDGVATVPTCGACNLGVVVCDEGENGGGSCVVPPIPNSEDLRDACTERVFYFQASAPAGGDGSQESPFNTLEGFQGSPGDVAVLSTEGVFAEAIKINNTALEGVSLLGGYNESWELDVEAKTQFRPPVTNGAESIGIEVVNVGEPALLYGLDVETQSIRELNPTEPIGATNYGMLVRLVQDDVLTVANLTVKAADGGPGADGPDGFRGADGPDGTAGTTGENSRGGRGALGGVNPGCPDANGGNGGRGAFNDQAGDVPALAGEESEGGAGGGAAGVNRLGGYAGAPGENGSDARSVGSAGTGGQAGGDISGGWVPSGEGGDGGTGAPGVGGGGGGGAWYGTMANGSFGAGPGGAGGGAGGCGGTGGRGGYPAGGSIGLLAVGVQMTIIDSTFAASTGGVGGAGGAPGGGGTGGEGGLGTNASVSQTGASTLPFKSGDGGEGGDGSQGGRGGGGAGGVSYGVVCGGARLIILGDVIFAAGVGGDGGDGTNFGVQGDSDDNRGCPL